MTTPGICPTNSIQTFPNALSLGTTNAEFFAKEGTYEPTNIEFRWAEQRTPPTFLDSTKGVLAPATGISNTLRYNGATYTLGQIMFVNKSHTTWILPPSAAADNQEDIIFTFVAEPSAQAPAPAQILIVVPILRSSTVTTTDPNYLKAMGPLGTYDFTNPISLSDFFPSTKTTAVSSNTMHLYYTTCAQGKNIMVIVQVYGIRISDAVMNIVKTAYNSVSTIFTPYGSPSSDVSFSPIPGAIDEAGFRTRIKYGYNLGETVVTQPPPSSADLVEAVDAYKCVPFDPDSQVDENGKIRINTATGELYSNVAVDREALKEEAKSLPGILSTAEKYVHGATTGLGIFIATTVFLILIYVLVWGGGGIGADENAGFFQRLALWFVKFIEKIFTPIVFIVTAGFIGIIIGATMF